MSSGEMLKKSEDGFLPTVERINNVGLIKEVELSNAKKKKLLTYEYLKIAY